MPDPFPRPDYAQMELAVFAGQDPGGVLWQPRIDYWYKVNKKRGTLPPHLRDADLLDVYDYCYGSARYFLWDRGWLRADLQRVEFGSTWLDGDRRRDTWRTPLGSLTQLVHHDAWRISAHTVEYRVKSPEDFKILRYIYEDERWRWDDAFFQECMARFGQHGAPQFYYRRSPFQRLIVEEMSFEDTIYFMNDYPDVLADYLAFAADCDDAMYDVICACPVQIVNFGENIDGSLDSPHIWNEYLVPYYQRRVDQLHAAGKFAFIHVDGVMRPLLPYLQAVPFDAIEACTPVPQGDVTLEEIKTALGDMALIDGIPALYFLPNLYPVEELVACAERVIDLFYPRLVLGVSDEVPPDGDIERVRLVGELARRHGSAPVG